MYFILFLNSHYLTQNVLELNNTDPLLKKPNNIFCSDCAGHNILLFSSCGWSWSNILKVSQSQHN